MYTQPDLYNAIFQNDLNLVKLIISSKNKSKNELNKTHTKIKNLKNTNEGLVKNMV